MSVITDKVPLPCPRHGCTNGTVYCLIAPELGNRGRYYVFRTEWTCDAGHRLSLAEWERAVDSAREVSRLWNSLPAKTGRTA